MARIYTVQELVVILDKTATQVRSYIRDGHLEASKKQLLGKPQYVVSTSDLQEFYDNYFNSKRFENKSRITKKY